MAEVVKGCCCLAVLVFQVIAVKKLVKSEMEYNRRSKR